MKGYKTSKDYRRLKELLDKGYEVVCYADYYVPPGIFFRDVCRARCDGNERYYITARGIEYTSYWPGMHRHRSFEDACKSCDIEFIEPEEE